MMLSCLATAGTPEDIDSKLSECVEDKQGEYKCVALLQTWLWNIARGISGEGVEGRILPKSHGSGKTFPGPHALRSVDAVSCNPHYVMQFQYLLEIPVTEKSTATGKPPQISPVMIASVGQPKSVTGNHLKPLPADLKEQQGRAENTQGRPAEWTAAGSRRPKVQQTSGGPPMTTLGTLSFTGHRERTSTWRGGVSHWLKQLCEELSERLVADLDQNKRIAHTLTLHVRAYKSNDTDSEKKFPSKSCQLRYGTSKMQEDALSLFHTGLREYMGVYGDKKNNGWGVTGLSVSASKILAIPQGTCTIMKFFPTQFVVSTASSHNTNDKSMDEVVQLSGSDGTTWSNMITGNEKTVKVHECGFDNKEVGKSHRKDQRMKKTKEEKWGRGHRTRFAPFDPSACYIVVTGERIRG
ncbi:LOW QUALITY PROTEIN: hypothetical protein Cgig2_021591 [Carnegiea gigantea]|uniref:DNA polymerase Y-family little finger domain-containing protein n=1 Tax=Carnegiea gigantea TaxID=171969 RepID=A0A9Q1JMF5_9CARY|nr:LOW QUALITY PROTEIN: hypothetical protein Cgig2_021591 [Carnegiea gigantea]